MPGFIIHIAVAKEYLNKHKSEIKNEDEFIKGAFAPDLDDTMTQNVKDKDKSHYGKWKIYPIEADFGVFLKDELVDLSTDYWKGYFLHLLSDFYFYCKYFEEETKYLIQNDESFYYDYDCLNDSLIKLYNIDILEITKKFMSFINGEPKYLDKDRVINFIDKISSLNLDDQIKIIYEKGMEGLHK